MAVSFRVSFGESGFGFFQFGLGLVPTTHVFFFVGSVLGVAFGFVDLLEFANLFPGVQTVGMGGAEVGLFAGVANGLRRAKVQTTVFVQFQLKLGAGFGGVGGEFSFGEFELDGELDPVEQGLGDLVIDVTGEESGLDLCDRENDGSLGFEQRKGDGGPTLTEVGIVSASPAV